MKLGFILALILVLTVTASRAVSGQQPPVVPIAEEPGLLMRSKLTSSQKVLEGLLRRDMDAVSQGAREMKRISEAAEWPRTRDAVYEHFSAEFRRQCAQMETLARDGNHQAASFVYLHMSTTCINCHDYVRDSLRIAEPGRRGDVQLIPSQWPDRTIPVEPK